MRKCKHCGSELVCWNWCGPGTWKNFIFNFRMNPSLKRLYFLLKTRHTHECWDCGHTFSTMFEVKDGLSYEELKTKYVHLPKHIKREIDDRLYYDMTQMDYWSDSEHDKKVWENRKKIVYALVDELYDKQWKIILEHISKNKK